MSRMLLHVCCAPCSPYVVEKLREEHDVTLYFYNPNIHPEQEYERRLAELAAWAEKEGLKLVVEEYGAEDWFEATRGMEDEPERGARCEACFDLRLKQAARKAAALGFDMFGTVLTVSPHKEAAVINRVGVEKGEEAGVSFLEADWKKKEGFKITTRKSRELGLYRQDYCGCVYSLRGRRKRAAAGS